VLTVDPGVESGWAVWSARDWGKCVPPSETGVVVPKTTLQWEDRIDAAIKQYEKEFRWYQFELVIIERPHFMEGERGNTAARADALVKLAIFYGMLRQLYRGNGVPVVPARVIVWKGQLKKDIVNARIEKRLGKTACKGFETHAWDAVGIGLWAKGYL
jgi:hypothetical protein